MKIYDRLPVIAFCALVVLIVLAGPISGLMHAVHLDPSLIAILIGIVAAACIVVVLFKAHLIGMISGFTSRLLRFEESVTETADDYLALPPGRESAAEQAYTTHGEADTETTSASSSSTFSEEPVLALAKNCPLPLSSALNHVLLLERPASQPGRTVATRLISEQFGQLSLPQLIITRASSMVSLLPLMQNGWIAGHPTAREERLAQLRRYAQQQPDLTSHFATVTEQNARAFGAKMLEANAQVILDLSTYPDPDHAARVLLKLLTGIHEYDGLCVIFLTEANRWLPNDTWLQQGYGAVPNLQLAVQLRSFIGQLMAAEKHPLYLSTEHLLSMDLRQVRFCKLWLLNMVPTPEDLLFITSHTGISEEGLGRLSRYGVLTDVLSRTAMEVALYKQQSSHEETGQRNTSGLLLDLSTVMEEEASLGKLRAEDGIQGGEQRLVVESSSAVSAGRPARPFTKQQLAFGVALLLADQLSETALRRPPSTKHIPETQITFADLAQELRLKNAFSEKDLLGHDRAEELELAVRSLSEDERRACEEEVRAALAAIVERRGSFAPTPSAPLVLDNPGATGGASRWLLPSTDLFKPPAPVETVSKDEVWAMARKIQGLLNGQKVAAEVLEEYIRVGSTVIQFGILPTGTPLKDKEGRIARDPAGAVLYEKETRVSEITKLKKDLMARLQATKIILQDPVPGTPFVGVQIPNPRPTPVVLRDVLEDGAYRRARMKSKLVIALGRNVAGEVRFIDLERSFTPHLLVAGSTGGGKSVCLNTIIASILTGATPDDVRLLMVDPKRVEFNIYRGIPHLLGDVISDPEKAAGALQSAVSEMERRYKRLEDLEVRDIGDYRTLRSQRRNTGDLSLENMPAIVVLIDELADLMLKVGDLVEDLICRIAALGRAAGIHLVVATQRPTVDVITGNVKNNIPARIAFLVGSAVDSNTILGQGGAESLQGKGDMLFQSPETDGPERIQCALTENTEAKELALYWRQAQPLLGEAPQQPIHPDELSQLSLLDQQWAELATKEAAAPLSFAPEAAFAAQEEEDAAELERAKELIRAEGRASISLLQRRMRIGYNRAARLIDLLEAQQFIGPEVKGGKSRAILADTPPTVDVQDAEDVLTVTEEDEEEEQPVDSIVP